LLRPSPILAGGAGARDYNLVHYTKMPRGGHFACFEQPQLLVEDVRRFFRGRRS